MTKPSVESSRLNCASSAAVLLAIACGGGNLCLAQTTVTTPDVVGPNLGGTMGPQFGAALAAGDFDGDGKREVAVATFEEESGSFTGNLGRGHVYVYEYDSGWSSGIAVPYPGGGEPPADTYFGYSMTAGNVDGDTYDELVISAPGGDDAAATNNGAVYIYDYNPTGPTFTLKHKFRSHESYGGQVGDNFGWSVALGDMNGDGDLDLLVGARYWSQCEEDGNCPDGRVSILEDWTGSVYGYDHDGFETSSNWREVNEASLVIRGEATWNPVDGGEQTRSYFGSRVAFVGDVNDDGYDDFVASAARRTPSDFAGSCASNYFEWSDDGGQTWHGETLTEDCRVGKVYLFGGASIYPGVEQQAEGYARVVFQGEDAEDKFGQGLASGGDLNGDGINDVVVGSRYHTETGYTNVGRVYVFLLEDYSGGWPNPTDFDAKHWDASEANIIIDGPTAENFVWFGYDLACDGNTNKGTGTGRDSRADLIVGAPRGDSCPGFGAEKADRGFAYLYRPGSMTAGEGGGHETWAAEGDSAAWYRIDCAATYERLAPQLGRAVAFMGDADEDADDDDDFVIGCPGWDTVVAPDKDDRGGIYSIFY